jgi:uncharacterized protein
MGVVTHSANGRIAVVGGGIAGLGAAWALSRKFHVTVYERDDVLGGHARTFASDRVGGGVPIDIGVFIMQEMLYPNLFELFRQLDVKTCSITTGLTLSSRDGDKYWRSSPAGAFPETLQREVDRFRLAVPGIVGNLRAHLAITLSQYLEREGYSRDFTDLVMTPVLASVFTTGADVMEAPVIGVALCFQPVPLLSLDGPTSWRTVADSTNAYVERLAASIAEVRLRSAVVRITRSHGGVTVVDEHGSREEFDQVVLAAEADNCLGMLADASPEERAILGGIRYDPARIVLHTDRRVMPADSATWTTFSYIVHRDRGKRQPYYVYHLNKIEPRLPSDIDVFTTVNPPDGLIDEGEIIGEVSWKHVVFDAAQALRTMWFHEIQGRNRTWFCGEHTASLGHEGSFVSGLAVAKAIGADFPFEHAEPARSAFYDTAAFQMQIVSEAEAGMPAGLWPAPLGRIMRQLAREDAVDVS